MSSTPNPSPDDQESPPMETPALETPERETPHQEIPAPEPPVAPAAPSSEARNWAAGAHLSAMAGALLGGLPAFLGPLAIWLVRRDEDAYSAEHAREALNFNLSVLLYLALAGVATVLTLGLGLLAIIPAGIAFAVMWLVVTLIATVRAANGEAYRYPLSIRFVS